jgi:hypothetical protein
MASNPSKITYLYKRTVEPKYWQEYLSRKLTNEEKFILSAAKREQQLNREIEKIYERAKLDGLYIPALTKFEGNCLFESFQIVGLCEDFNLFRVGLAQLLLILKNVPNFLPGFEEPLGDIFPNFIEIDLVKCAKTGRVYRYNYDAMCVDLAQNTSWIRNNTELMMRIICVILNINIVIYHVNGHITNVNTNPNENTLNVYIGQLGDPSQKNDAGYHFFPLKKVAEGEEVPKCITYTSDLTDYHKWARAMAKSLGKVVIEKATV